ncbi:hypothetical protein [Shewanella colwelliana]|uniref:hypothetical protein n=1 Tax=Shewanella colwelliana TaxID=23 RepID=UPI0004B39677
MSKPLYLILFSALTLTACGGSSSDNSGNPEVPSPISAAVMFHQRLMLTPQIQG